MNALTQKIAQYHTELHESDTQLDTIETTSQSSATNSYRDFCVNSCRKDIDWNRLVYSCIDADMYTEQVKKYDNCRTYAFFVRHKTTGQVKVQGCSCRLRWCPLCIKSRKFVIKNEVCSWVKKLKKPKFLTFTLKHQDRPLRDTVKDLYKYFRNVRRTKWFKKNVRGGVWFFQITKSKTDGLWHPHIHCLVDSNFLPKNDLSELWLQITGDSHIVDIRAVKNVKKTADYVARYATVPCRLVDFDIDDAIEIVQTMHGKRICGTWGTGKEMSFAIRKSDDWESWERIGNFSVIWHDLANPEWCRMIRACWISDTKLEYIPPPDLSGPGPWEKTERDEPEAFSVQLMLPFK